MDRESKRKAQYYLERGARFVNADTTIQLALRQQAEKRRTASRILHGTHTSCMFDQQGIALQRPVNGDDKSREDPKGGLSGDKDQNDDDDGVKIRIKDEEEDEVRIKDEDADQPSSYSYSTLAALLSSAVSIASCAPTLAQAPSSSAMSSMTSSIRELRTRRTAKLNGKLVTHFERCRADKMSDAHVECHTRRTREFQNADEGTQQAILEQAVRSNHEIRVRRGLHTSCMFDK